MSAAHEEALRDGLDYTLLPRVRHLEATNARLERDLAARDSQAEQDYIERDRLNAMLDKAVSENTELRQRLARCERGHHHDGG